MSQDLIALIIKAFIYIPFSILYFCIGYHIKNKKNAADILRIPIDFYLEKIKNIKQFNFSIFICFLICSILSLLFFIYEIFNPTMWCNSNLCMFMLIFTSCFLVFMTIFFIFYFRRN